MPSLRLLLAAGASPLRGGPAHAGEGKGPKYPGGECALSAALQARGLQGVLVTPPKKSLKFQVFGISNLPHETDSSFSSVSLLLSAPGAGREGLRRPPGGAALDGHAAHAGGAPERPRAARGAGGLRGARCQGRVIGGVIGEVTARLEGWKWIEGMVLRRRCSR